MIAQATKLRELHTAIFSGTDLVVLKEQVDAFLQAQEEALLQDWRICSIGQVGEVIPLDEPDQDVARDTVAALCIVIFYVTG